MDSLISIIVPVYNAEKTLERCVNSLTAQTYRNIEIILVNDGSRDQSLALCHEYAQKDSRIRIVDKPNGGVSSARNAGLDAAKGAFIMFCDSDDWVEPEWCECMHDHYAENDLTVCEIARNDIIAETHDMLVESTDRINYLHYPMLMCSPINKIFSRDVIENNQIRFSEELSLGEDFVFCLSYVGAICGRLHFLYRRLYNYDTVSEGLSKKAPELKQCDLFYTMMTDRMKQIGIADSLSIQTRNRFVISHFDRFLTQTAENSKLSVLQKTKVAEEVGSLESFCSCSADGLEWETAVLRWAYKKKRVKLIMLYMILRGIKRRRK